MGTYDQIFKTIFTDKRILMEFINMFIPELTWYGLSPEDITEENIEFTDVKHGRKETDLLFRIRREDGDAFLFLLLEHQSSVDYLMPLRLLSYMVRIWEKYVKENEKASKRKSFKLPVIIPVVFYNGAKKWDAHIRFASKVWSSEEFREHVPDFKYRVVDVGRLNVKRLEEMKNALVVLLGIDGAKKEDIEGIKEWVNRLYDELPEEERELLKEYGKLCLIGMC